MVCFVLIQLFQSSLHSMANVYTSFCKPKQPDIGAFHYSLLRLLIVCLFFHRTRSNSLQNSIIEIFLALALLQIIIYVVKSIIKLNKSITKCYKFCLDYRGPFEMFAHSSRCWIASEILSLQFLTKIIRKQPSSQLQCFINLVRSGFEEHIFH